MLGSVSKYCLEHAPCHVTVVKEEVEKNKIEEDRNVQKEEKFQSELDRNIARMAEGIILLF